MCIVAWDYHKIWDPDAQARKFIQTRRTPVRHNVRVVQANGIECQHHVIHSILTVAGLSSQLRCAVQITLEGSPSLQRFRGWLTTIWTACSYFREHPAASTFADGRMGRSQQGIRQNTQSLAGSSRVRRSPWSQLQFLHRGDRPLDDRANRKHRRDPTDRWNKIRYGKFPCKCQDESNRTSHVLVHNCRYHGRSDLVRTPASAKLFQIDVFEMNCGISQAMRGENRQHGLHCAALISFRSVSENTNCRI